MVAVVEVDGHPGAGAALVSVPVLGVPVRIQWPRRRRRLVAASFRRRRQGLLGEARGEPVVVAACAAYFILHL